MSSNTNANNVTALPSAPKPQASKEVIAANALQLLIEQLEAGQSESFTAYLTAMGRFHVSFARVWNRNLRAQGFAATFERQRQQTA
jgi:hypothetical protein